MNDSANSQSSRKPLTPKGPADAETIKLVEEIKALAADVLGRGIERMFDGADDMLFEMARRATNNKDQRIYFDTMRVVRLGRPKIGGIFRGEIKAGFAVKKTAAEETRKQDLELDELSLQESKSLEESIAISSMATKAEGLYAQMLYEIGRRIEWLIKEKNAPIAEDALAPATISHAFRRSAETLDVEFDIELVIFKLFDRLVISDLGELYTRVLRFMDQQGVKTAAVAGRRPPGPQGGAAAAAGGVPPQGATEPGAPDGMPAGGGAAAAAGYGFPNPPMMDAGTLNTLRQLSAGQGFAGPGAEASGGVPYGGGAQPMGAGVVYGPADARLGSDLAAAASGQIVPGWEAPRAYAYVQRAGAVGQMFNDLMQDPTLPAPLKPRFDQLRFSVIKSALRDSSFFADNRHPVRGLMNELTTLAASARASGMEALQRIEELVGQIQSQFDVAADEVRTQTALPGKVDESTLEKFFAQQKEEARQRRQAIIERTRRVVAEELQLQTLSRKIPDGTWPLLNSGWAPLAALRLLKQGADSEGWQEAMALLKRILDSVNPRRPASRSKENIRALEIDVRERLREVGMVEERIQSLIQSWRNSLEAVEADSIAPPKPEAAAPAATSPQAEVAPTEAQADAEPADAAEAFEAPAEDAQADDLGEVSLEDLAAEQESTAAASQTAKSASETLPDAPVAQADPDEVAAELEDRTDPPASVPDAITLLDLLMVLSSWFRVYDHDRGQNRWLKVVAHHPSDSMVTFAEFNGQNKLQMRTSIFLDDLVAGRAEPIDLGPAARRSLEAYLDARRQASEDEAATA